jgi:hypothetical protein
VRRKRIQVVLTVDMPEVVWDRWRDDVGAHGEPAEEMAWAVATWGALPTRPAVEPLGDMRGDVRVHVERFTQATTTDDDTEAF